LELRIERVTSKRDLRNFIYLPFEIYQDNPYWVPPLLLDEYASLRKDKNPAFDFCQAEYWLAYRDGKIVGRIAGIINPKANEKWGHSYARFGWVDFVEDYAVAEVLFAAVIDWAKEHGMTGLQGPMGFTDFDKEGMLVEGFNELGTLPMIYNHAYYPEYLERLGFSKEVDWIEFEIKCPREIPEKVLRVSQASLKRQGLEVAKIKNRRELAKKYGRQIFEIVNEAYADLYGTTPVTERQMDFYIDLYLGFVNVRYVPIIVDATGKAVGFGLAMPSLSRGLQRSRGRIFPIGWWHLWRALARPVSGDMYLVAVRKQYQNKGLTAILMTEILQNAIADGMVSAESSGELETNQSVQQIWRHYDVRQHKRRRAYKFVF